MGTIFRGWRRGRRKAEDSRREWGESSSDIIIIFFSSSGRIYFFTDLIMKIYLIYPPISHYFSLPLRIQLLNPEEKMT